MSGVVETAIRLHLTPNERLQTPVRGAPFIVDSIGAKGVTLLLGAGAWPTFLSWECLEGVIPYLRSLGTVEIGSKYDTEGREGTLDGYLKRYVNRATAGWVAALFEKAGLVEIVRTRPAKIKLTAP